jgi:tRNA threonylcarbamoyladenosine biosynthesis protein TsaE
MHACPCASIAWMRSTRLKDLLELPDAAATVALGHRIGAALRAGEAVLVRGALGAGKTTLARGAVAAWAGEQEEVPSPTYTLVQIYNGSKGELWHADLYRLKSIAEAEEIGLLDALGREACLIEWPERLGAAAPPDRLEVDLHWTDAARAARLAGFGAWRERLHEL